MKLFECVSEKLVSANSTIRLVIMNKLGNIHVLVWYARSC